MKSNPINQMKKLSVVFFLTFFSCASITEEIYLNADGSGEYLVYSDVISSTQSMMMGMMSGMYPDASEDSLRQIVDEQIWAEFPAEIDSIIDFSGRVPDSIKNDPAKKKYLDKMEMFMKGSKAERYLNSGMRFSFRSIEDLQGFQDFMNENQTATSGGMGMEMPSVNVKYSFDANSFSRVSDMEIKMDENDSSMLVLGELLKGSKSRLILHLPRKVKSVSKGLVVDQSGKDVIFEFDLIKVLNGEQSTDVKVEF
ncbi:hypothetical protein [Ekhidna sp.]|uniref:hypothetical protein n=1 Tax=Ekhidna sp. TaxID=2608089 RepID=UPI003518C89F